MILKTGKNIRDFPKYGVSFDNTWESLDYKHVGKVIGRSCGKSMTALGQLMDLDTQPFNVPVSVEFTKDSVPVINTPDGFTASCYVLDEDIAKLLSEPDDLWTILGKGFDSKMFELNVIPERIIVSGPCTIFFWNDKTKTIVRCSENDTWDISDAIVAAYTKRLLGDRVYSHIKQKSNSKRIRDMIEWKD